MSKKKTIRLLLRIGIFGTFSGHGLCALSINLGWIPLLTCYGFSPAQAKEIMPLIGLLDIAVAFTVLFYPIRIVLIWAIFWAFITALSRPISGGHMTEFVERSANWMLPLTLLVLHGLPKNGQAYFKIRK